tara:strand:+ start:1701 stop:1931 length:231 start_codon:yes stop_codon:yes gene_type:complete
MRFARRSSGRTATTWSFGSRGLSSVQQNVLHLVGLGSVGEHVAHHAHVPVTIVPPITPVEEIITVRGARVGVKRKK